MIPALTQFMDYLAVVFDLPILYWIQDNLTCAFMDFIMPLITLFGEGGIFWIAIAVVLLIFPKTRKIGLGMGIALLIGVLVCNVTLKNVVGRIRPYDFIGMDPAELLISGLGDKSFPSGHTIASFEAATVLLRNNKKMGIPAMILAVLIAFSRLYLFVHYPTDVITSVVLGTIIAIIADNLAPKVLALIPTKKVGKYQA